MMIKFRIPLRTTPWPKGLQEAHDCPVCGEYWHPWPGSYLNCHARCLLTDESQTIIREDPRNNTLCVAHYGLSLSVIKSVRA